MPAGESNFNRKVLCNNGCGRGQVIRHNQRHLQRVSNPLTPPTEHKPGDLASDKAVTVSDGNDLAPEGPVDNVQRGVVMHKKLLSPAVSG